MLNFSAYNKIRLREWMKENHGKLMVLRPKQIESSKQRGWFEGGLIPFIAYHQEFLDHRDKEDLEQVREWLKMEFNADLVAIGGKIHKVAKSTKGVLNEGLIETILGWANEQGMKTELLDPKIWKHWHDTIYPFGGPDNFIDYLVEIKKLP
jgi:hypothetical protein